VVAEDCPAHIPGYRFVTSVVARWSLSKCRSRVALKRRVLFSAFGQPGSITRFCITWPNVTSLQLICVASPDWASRNHTYVDTSGPKTFDDGRHLSEVVITSWSKIKGIAWVANLVRNRYLSYGELTLGLLGLGSFFRLFALGSVRRRR